MGLLLEQIGGKEYVKFFNSMGDQKKQNKAFKKYCGRVMEALMLPKIKARIPKRTWNIYNSLVVKPKTSSRNKTIGAQIAGYNKGQSAAYYGVMLEYGHKLHNAPNVHVEGDRTFRDVMEQNETAGIDMLRDFIDADIDLQAQQAGVK